MSLQQDVWDQAMALLQLLTWLHVWDYRNFLNNETMEVYYSNFIDLAINGNRY